MVGSSREVFLRIPYVGGVCKASGPWLTRGHVADNGIVSLCRAKVARTATQPSVDRTLMQRKHCDLDFCNGERANKTAD